MSIRAKGAAVARHAAARTVAYVREFVLITTYAAICIALALSVLIATGTAIYWSIRTFGLQGQLRTATVVGGGVVVMVEFAMLHRFSQTLGYVMLGPTRGMKV